MAITFNDLIDFGRIYRATGGGVVFSSNLASSTVFDYFDDSPSVNDAIYFGITSPLFAWKDLTFYVGTAMAGTYTLAWEYRKTNNTWATLSVTDNTNDFQTTGENMVTFTPPADWKNQYGVNGSVATWIRVRLSAITSVTEGGAQSTQKVQCGNFAVNVVGYSTVTPATFTDIYNADVSGGWGVVSNQGSQFRLGCNLYVGDGSTASYLETKNEQVQMDGGVTLLSSGEFYIGELIDLDKRTTKNGSAIYFSQVYCNAYGQFLAEGTYIYNSYIDNAKFLNSFTRLINSVVNDTTITPYSDTLIYRIVVNKDSEQGMGLSNGTFDDLFIHNCREAIITFWNGQERTITNLRARDNTDFFRNSTTAGTQPLNLIDTDTDSWSMYWAKAPASGFAVYEKYTFNLQVLDGSNNGIEGATVKLQDKDGTEIFSVSTAADGTITEQTVTAKKYEHDSGTHPGTTTTTDYNDFTLVVQKIGYQSIIEVFTIDDKINWVMLLQLCCPRFDNLSG